jgi:hypothetical protein
MTSFSVAIITDAFSLRSCRLCFMGELLIEFSESLKA